MNQFKKRYAALKRDWPELPGETTWLDRINTWEQFLERGQDVADQLAGLFSGNLENHGEAGVDYYDEDFRGLYPEAHDLLMEAYEKTEVLKHFKED